MYFPRRIRTRWPNEKWADDNLFDIFFFFLFSTLLHSFWYSDITDLLVCKKPIHPQIERNTSKSNHVRMGPTKRDRDKCVVFAFFFNTPGQTECRFEPSRLMQSYLNVAACIESNRLFLVCGVDHGSSSFNRSDIIQGKSLDHDRNHTHINIKKTTIISVEFLLCDVAMSNPQHLKPDTDQHDDPKDDR